MTDIVRVNDELLPEYDETLLKNGIRDKYAKRYAFETIIVRIRPETLDPFHSGGTDNESVRSVLKESNKEK